MVQPDPRGSPPFGLQTGSGIPPPFLLPSESPPVPALHSEGAKRAAPEITGLLANQPLPGTELRQQEQKCPLTSAFFHSLFQRPTGLWMGVRSCPGCGPCRSSFTEREQWVPQRLEFLPFLSSTRNLQLFKVTY